MILPQGRVGGNRPRPVHAAKAVSRQVRAHHRIAAGISELHIKGPTCQRIAPRELVVHLRRPEFVVNDVAGAIDRPVTDAEHAVLHKGLLGQWPGTGVAVAMAAVLAGRRARLGQPLHKPLLIAKAAGVQMHKAISVG